MKIDRQSIEAILAGVRWTQDEELSCDEITDEMFAAYAAMQRSEDGVAGDEAIALHMRHCLHCSRLLAEVTASLEWIEHEGGTEAFAPQRRFDLSFLPAEGEARSWPTGVLAAFEQGAAWVQDQQGALWLRLAAVSDAQPSTNYVPVTKGTGERSAESDEILYHFVLDIDDVTDLDLEVIGGRQAESALCSVTVQAINPSRWPQVGGVDVELLFGSRVRHVRTDERGQAVFRNIPVADLPNSCVRVLR